MDQPRREDFGELGEFTVGGSDELMGEMWVGRSPKGTQDLGGAFEALDEWRHNFLTVLEVNEEIRGLTPVLFPPLGEGDLTSVVGEAVSGGVIASWYDGGGGLGWGVLRRAVTLVAGFSELARKADDFVRVASPSRLTSGEGPNGGSSGSLGHEELNLDGFILGKLEVVEGGEGGGRGGPLESVSSALIQLGGSSGRGDGDDWGWQFHSWDVGRYDRWGEVFIPWWDWDGCEDFFIDKDRVV